MKNSGRITATAFGSIVQNGNDGTGDLSPVGLTESRQ